VGLPYSTPQHSVVTGVGSGGNMSPPEMGDEKGLYLLLLLICIQGFQEVRKTCVAAFVGRVQGQGH
jgi:hypothetical protein